MSEDTSRRFPSVFKGVASGRTGVRGGPRLFNQLADDRDRVRPVPSLARLAWLERPDPDTAHEDWARSVAAYVRERILKRREGFRRTMRLILRRLNATRQRHDRKPDHRHLYM
jgi:hypothetical protein